MTRVVAPILTMLTQKFLHQLLTFINLYELAKNQAISTFSSRDIVHLKILQSDWLSAFWPISQELDFSKTHDLSWNIATNINFQYRPNREKN